MINPDYIHPAIALPLVAILSAVYVWLGKVAK